MSSLNQEKEKFLAPPEIAANLVTPSAYVGDRPILLSLKTLREQNPVALIEAEGYDPFWIVTKHADIREVSLRNDLFHSGDRSIFLMDSASVRHVVETTGRATPFHNILVMDSPEHRKYRALTQAWFMPQQVIRREANIRRIAKATVDRMLAGDGDCEFVNDVSLRYPLRVIMEILGAPDEDEELLLRLTKELVGGDDPDLGRGEEKDNYAEGFSNVLADFNTYFKDLMIARRHSPTDDVASVIANSVIDGALIDEQSVFDYYMGIATAGHDTTSSSIAGGVWALAENPAEFAKAQKDLALIPNLVNEAIRWTTPILHFMRSATADTELRGRKIAKGDWLMLSYISANQDEEVFDDPTSFKVDRSPNAHLAFGYGGHNCIGMHLAKLEMRIFFEELLPRLKSIELAGVPKRAEGNFMTGPKFLPVRFLRH